MPSRLFRPGRTAPTLTWTPSAWTCPWRISPARTSAWVSCARPTCDGRSSPARTCTGPTWRAGALLDAADLTRACLVRTELNEASMQGTLLRGSNLDSASLCGVDARGADLGGACLDGAALVGIRLQGADLTDASVREISFEGLLFAYSVRRYGSCGEGGRCRVNFREPRFRSHSSGQ
ncbi:hypothetical protein GPA10_01235 [Streptomyces sp. p1417]|uniref:Pentapeptide repeat-containing protein n=2 Tax=Streptomyces typhae TaxID=2681492 RepID=A0A6L6WMS2_9ACTN|nr:hypothetical protein [Streptomyces typhae]